jgi:hypothetical protein
MLKRSAAVVLMVLYVITVSGFALNLHYCFDRISSFQIDAPARSCVKELETKKMKCCKDKHIEVKVKDAHQTGSIAFAGKIFVADLPKLKIADLFIAGNDLLFSVSSYRGPPPPPDINIYLKNCNFRV